MNKLCTTLFLLFVFAAGLMAQPTNWNSALTSGGENSFPMNQPAGKGCQWLVRAGEYNLPTPAPAGKVIHTFYLRLTSNATYQLPPGTYTQFRIILQTSTITDLPVGSWYTGGNPDTVFYRASYVCPGGVNIWLPFVLDHDYPYDPTKSLIIQVEQCGWTGSGGFSLVHATLAGNRRVFSVGGCPIQPYNLAQTNCVVNAVELVDASAPNFPDYLYYKFENNPSASSITNCAIPGVGTTTATISGSLTPGGQFDSCITETGAASQGWMTGWNCNLGQSSWTISMWLTIPSTSSGSAFYLFGDAGSGSFRCFHNGVALPNNLVLRGPITDVTVTGIGPAPTCVTFVRDSAAGQIRAYKNGVLAVTSTQAVNLPTGTGFKVGGYGSSPGFVGKMDEFRLYHRALTPAEVTEYWNQDPGGCGIVAINENNNNVPKSYRLDQNYPNPFNPNTTISFGLPKASNVKIIIYDILGREVDVLLNAPFNAGNHSVDFNASNLASGVYMYRIEAGDFVSSKKMTLVK